MDFKREDYIKVKEGIKFPELNIDISDWQGKIMEVHKVTVEVELDSTTLLNFNESLFKHFQKMEDYPHIVLIPKTDIEKIQPRSNDENLELIQDQLIEKMDSIDKNDPPFQQLSRKWTRHFIRSEYYSSMTKVNRQNTDSVIELFTNQMYDYEGQTPKKWTLESAKEVFLNWAPSKISADKEFFESYGIVLINYFKFLYERKYLKTTAFEKLLIEVKDEIVIKSQNHSNWGIAKSFMMKAKEAGVDLHNKEEINEFLMKEQLKAFENLSVENQDVLELENQVNKTKFKGISRNQKITVKYKNGEIKENIKFKYVENDLLKGVCELIKN